jgi:hypothetical protein
VVEQFGVDKDGACTRVGMWSWIGSLGHILRVYDDFLSSSSLALLFFFCPLQGCSFPKSLPVPLAYFGYYLEHIPVATSPGEQFGQAGGMVHRQGPLLLRGECGTAILWTGFVKKRFARGGECNGMAWFVSLSSFLPLFLHSGKQFQQCPIRLKRPGRCFLQLQAFDRQYGARVT